MLLKEKVKIITDSAADFWGYDAVAHLEIIHDTPDDKSVISYKDGVVTKETIFENVQKGHRFTTSCPSDFEFRNLFMHWLKEYEYLIYLGLSSDISNTYNVANRIKNEIDPRRIITIDTRQVTLAQQLIVRNALDYLEKMTDLKEFFYQIKTDISKTELRVILHTLKYVAAGGRLKERYGTIVGKAAEIAAKIGVFEKMGVRIIVKTENGEIVNCASAKGNTIKVAAKHLNELFDSENINEERVIFGGTKSQSDVVKLIDLMASAKKIKDTIIAEPGSIISNHAGPNALAMAYTRK